MRVIYSGSTPYAPGINQAKRVARAHDRRDNILVQRVAGFGLPTQHEHHQELVKQRHRYYAQVYQLEQERKQRDHQAAEQLSSIGFGDPSQGLSTASVTTHAEGVSESADLSDPI